MKKYIIIILLFGANYAQGQTVQNTINTKFSNQVNIGKGGTQYGTTDASAWLEIGNDNTTKSVRISRGDTATVVSPTYGLVHYQISNGKLYWRDASKWNEAGVPSNTYVKYSDTSIMLQPYINSVGYGLIKSGQQIEVDTTDPNGIATISDILNIPPYSLCDTLNSFPTTSYTSGMKLLTSSGGTSIPSNYVGWDYDLSMFPNACNPNTNIDNMAIYDIQFCGINSIPPTPIPCDDVVAVQDFFNNVVIPDYNACSGFTINANEILYTYDPITNVPTMWVEPSISPYPFHNLVIGPIGVGACEKIEPNIPTINPAPIGSGCSMVILPTLDTSNTNELNQSFINNGNNLLELTDEGSVITTPIITANSLNYNTGTNTLSSSVNGVATSVIIPIAKDSSTWNKVNTTLPSDDINDNIYHNGNVGIGVFNPSHKLHVWGGAVDGGEVVAKLSSNDPGWSVGGIDGISLDFAQYNTAVSKIKAGVFTFNSFDLGIFSGPTATAGNTPQSIFKSSGNFGVGVIDPQNKIEVGVGIANTGGIRLPITSSSTAQVGQPIGVNASGDIVRIASSGGGDNGSLIAGTGISITGTAPNLTITNTATAPATTNTLTNPTNTITSTVNGIVATAPAVNSVANSFTSPNLTTTINGVASTPISLTTLYTANNGLTKTGTVLQRGGNLIQNTTETLNGFTAEWLGSTYRTIMTTTGQVGIGLQNLSSLPGVGHSLTVGTGTGGRAAKIGFTEFTTGVDPTNTSVGIRVDAASRAMNLIASALTTTDPYLFSLSHRNGALGTGFVATTSGQVDYCIITGTAVAGSPSFAPGAGNAVYNHLRLRPSINQTGTATGITRGLFIDGTGNTNAVAYKALETNIGNVLLNTTNGNTGIGTATPTSKLHVIGNIVASGTITPSDMRVKKDIVNYGDGLSKVLQLNPVTYKFSSSAQLGVDTNKTEIGFLAQNLESIYGPNVNTKFNHSYAKPDTLTIAQFNAIDTNNFTKAIVTSPIFDTTIFIDQYGADSSVVTQVGTNTFYLRTGIKDLRAPNLQYINASMVNAVKDLGTRDLVAVLAPKTTNITTPQLLEPNNSLKLVRGYTYEVKLYARWQTSNASNGCRFLNTFTGAGTPIGEWRGSVTNQGSSSCQNLPITFGQEFFLNSASSSNQPHVVMLSYLITPTSTGELRFLFGSENSTSNSTLLAGSTVVVTRLN